MSVQDRVIDIDGLGLHYREWGHPQAPPLLLLHAGGCHAHWWNATAGRFSDRYRVIAPDLRGHGDSDRSVAGDYTFEAYASDVAAFVEALGLEDVQVVGHSLGGYVGLVYASRRPARLRALVITDMLCELDGAALDRLRDAGNKPTPIFSSRAEAEARFRLQPPETVAPLEVLAELTAHAVTQTQDGRFTFKFDRRAMGLPPVRAWDVAPSVTCPTLIVRGERSNLMPREHAERLAALFPDARLRQIAGAYHHVMLDDPHGFAAVLDDFLSRARPSVSTADR
jgi:esterase